MDPQSMTILLGASQRIIGILIGGMLVYFGYRLFLSLPGKRGRDDGSGEFSLGRSSKVKLSKVGPGVFFAIFGAGLIAYSFAKPMKVNIPAPTQTAPAPSVGNASGAASAPSAGTGEVAAGFSYIGAVSAPETDEDRARMRTETQQDIIVLNRALDGTNASERPQVERAVVRAKVALMEPLWAEDWGELKDFRDWLAKGGTPPAKTQPAVDYFQRK
jgi:hypothetical protein